jgi:endo-1,4-beta-D-glucanase Y
MPFDVPRRAGSSGTVSTFLLGLVFALGCSSSGGAVTGSGGSMASGGSTASGGAPASGGVTGSGGNSASGGSVGSGGVTASGGAAATGSGGSTASGGVVGSGGTAVGGGAGMSASGGSSGGGATGSGGNTSACKAGPPAAPAGGASFPFPQNRYSNACTYPAACTDADAMNGWKMYKARLLVDGGDGSLRIQRPENANDTVSEGIGYGMLFAVYMNEKDTFDGLWKYAQKSLDSTGLMNWHLNSDGSVASGGQNSATDGDEDMGFALVMADKQWGGYTSVAKDFLGKMAKNDFASDGTIKGGDKYANAVNPSYLAPAYYRTFAAYSGDATWTTILEKSYTLLQMATNGTTGLVPDWSVPAGRGPDYKYDAARTPFRIALDACWNNEKRAVTFSQGIAKFFADVGVMNIMDGYNVSTGMAISTNVNATFIGPAGVSGMPAGQTKLVEDAYAFVAATANKGTDSYYNLSWALFGTLMMTGNFVDFTLQ